jgi:hypothetical protein
LCSYQYRKRKTPSSWMWNRVGLVRTNVSEESVNSVVRVKKNSGARKIASSWLTNLTKRRILQHPHVETSQKTASSIVTTMKTLNVEYRKLPQLKYSASHSRVAPENVGLQKEQNYNTFAFIPVMKCSRVFWEFSKRKLATREVKIR